MRLLLTSIVVGLFLSVSAYADDTDAEIEYLVSTIGASDCTFIRNGKRHDADDAEAHLRMKYRRGKRYAPTAEKFIERLASASSMSKKPYFIECDGQEAVPSGEWLTAQLHEYRRL
ncbi:MAG: DUF5329 domain-containing protein [Woeseiaceae bacterium]